jgi:rhombotail lipoprotein
MELWKLVLASASAFLLAGCSLLTSSFLNKGLGGAHHSSGNNSTSSSSLVSFLYPYGATPPPNNQIPELRLPLRVGLAFLPERPGRPSALTAAHKEELLKVIRARFLTKRFVREIIVMPDYYLKGARGFEGLDGVQRLFGIDVLALVSYDQVTYQDQNQLSLGYLSIVGAYLLNGNRHDITTLIDLAIVDPATRSLILRAGGTDTRHGYATLISQERESRDAAIASFAAATGEAIQNFDRALVTFETDVRLGKANIRVAQRNSSTSAGGGGGSMTWPALALLLPVLFFRRKAQLQDTETAHVPRHQSIVGVQRTRAMSWWYWPSSPC